MREGAPDAIRLGAERIAVHDECRNMQQGAMDVGHMHRKQVDIDCRHVQTLLMNS
jgi:hypothetical protein